MESVLYVFCNKHFLFSILQSFQTLPVLCFSSFQIVSMGAFFKLEVEFCEVESKKLAKKIREIVWLKIVFLLA
jgi:hypothetical protein